jgi:hypothetical protein
MPTSLLGSVMVQHFGEVMEFQGNQGEFGCSPGMGYKNREGCEPDMMALLGTIEITGFPL